MIKKTSKAALAVAAVMAAGLSGLASPAAAAIYTATYTGQISDVMADGAYAHFFDGSDVSAGAAFTAVFRWDEADAGPGSADLPGQYSLYTGAVTAKVTVGASSYAFQAPGSLIGFVDAPDGDTSTIVHYLDTVYAPGQRYAVQLYTTGGGDLLNTWDWRTPGAYDLTVGDANGAFVFQGLGGADDIAGAVLKPTLLVVAREGGVSAAPEPAAWSMMIMGFGGAGATLRRRTAGVRRKAAAQA